MKKINPPVKYFGSKAGFSKEILKYFPDSTEYDTYIEPYGGAYNVGLNLNPLPKIEIYNDLYKNVYSLYKVLSDSELFIKFKNKCDLIFYNEDLRKEYKDVLKTNDLSILDRAFYYFYVNRTSHNGIGGFSKNMHIRRNMSKSISDFLSCVDRLPELHNRLSRVIMCNTDGLELIKKYNTQNVMIYNDVPYEQSTRTGTRYDVDMDREGHIKFLDAVLESNAKILISGYDCELYNVLGENGWKKVNFEVKTIDGNFKPKTKVEYLYFNY